MISKEEARENAEHVVSVNGVNNFYSICRDVALETMWTYDSVSDQLKEAIINRIADLYEKGIA